MSDLNAVFTSNLSSAPLIFHWHEHYIKFWSIRLEISFYIKICSYCIYISRCFLELINFSQHYIVSVWIVPVFLHVRDIKMR